MALKRKIAKLEDVAEAVRGEYVADPAGGFILQTEGDEDTGALKRAKDHEAAARRAAEKRVKELEDANAEAAEAARVAAEEAAKKSGNVAALEKSWSDKLTAAVAAAEAKFKPEVDSLTTDVQRLLIDNVAQAIASKVAVKGSEEVLVPHIQRRLRVEVRDGKRVTVVVDADGKPSASSIDDLTKEIVGHKAFAPLIAGSGGSGGGAGGTKPGGAPGAKSLTRKEFDGLDPAAKAKHVRDRGTVTDA